MSNWDRNRIDRSKERVTGPFWKDEYQNLLRRVRADNLKMKPGQLAHKYSKQVIEEALKEEMVNAESK
jgi:hypothetical protein